MAYNIPRPVAIAQPAYLGGASPLASGIQSGVQLAGMLQQRDARAQKMELQQLQLDQARQQMTEQEAKAALGSVAQGAEDVLAIQGNTPEETQTARYNYLANRLDNLRQQGKDTEQTDEALVIGLNEGFDSPAFDQAMREGIQAANSFGVFTPKQQLEREQAAKLAAESQLSTKEKNKIRMDFRREFATTAGKGLLESTEQIDKIRKAQKTGIGDVTLMKTINKMIDNGIVTDSDFDQVAQSSGIADTFQGLFNRVIGGGSLNEVTRKQILNQAEALYGAKLQSAYGIAQGIEQDAGGYGVSDVIGSGFQKLFKKNKGLLEQSTAKPVNWSDL